MKINKINLEQGLTEVSEAIENNQVLAQEPNFECGVYQIVRQGVTKTIIIGHSSAVELLAA